MRPGFLSTVLALLALAAASAAQQGGQPTQGSTAPPQQPPVTYRVEINYVEVDAVVTDERGNIVRGLTRDDFEVFEDGKPQKIEIFSHVDIPLDRPQRFMFASRPVVPDVKSNARPFDGRLYVIVLDDYHTAALRSPLVRRAAQQFVEKHFNANDLAAVVYTSGRLEASQEFTNDPRLLTASVEKFLGQKLRSRTLERLDEYYRKRSSEPPPSDSGSSGSGRDSKILDPLDFERGFKARSTLGTLKNLAEFMSGIRGRRKAILFFSEGIDYPIYDVFDSRDATTIVQETRDAITAAARANVNFFTIDPRGLHNMGDELMDMQAPAEDPALQLNPSALQDERRLSTDSLRTLAEETGGFAAVESNDFQQAFDRIVRENSSYYVLGYYPPSDKRDGRFHRIQVKVKRPGLKVVARKGYSAPKGKPEKTNVDPSAGTSAVLKELLNSPLPTSGLTMSVQAAAFIGTKDNVSVTVEIAGPPLKFEEKGGMFLDTIELSLLPLESRGKALQGTRSEVQLKLRPQTYELARQTGLRLSPRLSLPAGRYQLRVAARESGAGLSGAVFYDLEVPDFTKTKLSMSGIILTAATAGLTATAQADESLKKLLPGPPTTRREFYNIDTLALYAEVYDMVGSSPPHKVDVTTTVRAEDGREVFKSTEEHASGELQGKTGGYGYSAKIPLKEFAPGRYLIQVDARSRLKDIEPTSRELFFTVVAMPPERPSGGGE